MPFKKWLEKYDIKEIYDFNVRNGYELLDMKFYLKNKTRRYYSLMQIFMIGLSIIMPALTCWWNRPINGSKYLVCTELVGDFFMRFFGCNWNGTTDTISLVETRNEILRKWNNHHGNISGS